jgi:hypothetical protein
MDMTNRTAPTHTALITFDPMRQLDTVLILDLGTGHVVDRLVVDDAEWVSFGADHLSRRGFETVGSTRSAGSRGVSTWPLVRA